jgi:hypothetical protein
VTRFAHFHLVCAVCARLGAGEAQAVSERRAWGRFKRQPTPALGARRTHAVRPSRARGDLVAPGPTRLAVCSGNCRWLWKPGSVLLTCTATCVTAYWGRPECCTSLSRRTRRRTPARRWPGRGCRRCGSLTSRRPRTTCCRLPRASTPTTARRLPTRGTLCCQFQLMARSTI